MKINTLIIAAGVLGTLLLSGCFSPKPQKQVHQITERTRPKTLTRDYMIKNNDLRGWQETDDDVMRRTAFRMLMDSPEHRMPSARKGLTDRDPVIRRSAVYALYETDHEKALPEITKLGKDPDYNVRYMVALCAAALAKENSAEAMLYLENTAKLDSDPRIRQFATRSAWPYYRDTKLLRDKTSGSQQVTVVNSIKLPVENWKFQLDPSQNGHMEGWQQTDFDAAEWNVIDIGPWQDQGVGNYHGAAWYRIQFNMPEQIECKAVELDFAGIEDSAWVWLNGVYIGQYDLGKKGGAKAFRLDATQEIRWNAENLLVVRVVNNAGKGGIVKPVSVDVLK